MDDEEQQEYERCYGTAFTYASKRRRSSGEVESRLRFKGFDSVQIEAVLTKINEIGLVDDHDYCRAWIADRINLRPRSKRVMYAELLARRIDKDIVARALVEMDARAYSEAIRRVIEKRKRETSYADDDFKLKDYLFRQGYTGAEIDQALAGD